MSEIVLECKACHVEFNHKNNKRWYCSDCKPKVRKYTAMMSARRKRLEKKQVGVRT